MMPRFDFSRAFGRSLVIGLFIGLVSSRGAWAAGPERPQRGGSVAGSQSARIAIPVYGSILQMGLPEGWKLAHEQATPAQYLAEFTPAGQGVDNWQEMVTVQGFRGLADKAGMTPKIFLRRIAEGLNQTCPRQVLGYSLGERTIDGRPATLALLGCASLPAKPGQPARSEFALYVAMTSGADLVLLQKARRGPPLAAEKPPLQGAELEAFWSVLQPLRLCSGGAGNPRCP